MANLLDQELAKYPPARTLVAVPFHRRVFSWYFGQALMFVTLDQIESRTGSNADTLVSLDAAGFPSISPISVPDTPFDHFGIAEAPALPDGPALVLRHRESDDMSDLRHAAMRGTLRGEVFTVHRRIGSLEQGGRDGELERRRNASAARKLMADWPPP